MTDSEILRTGVLFKKGSGSGPFGRKNWKPRYFVLTTSRLQYFTFEDGELKGELSLQGCDEGVLEVMPADSMKTGSSASTIWRVAINAPERRLLVAAGTEMEMNDWVDKLVLAFRLNAGQPVLQRASMPASSSVLSSCLLSHNNNGPSASTTTYCNTTTASNSSAINCNPSIRDFQNFSVPRRGMAQRHSTGMDMRATLKQDEAAYSSSGGAAGEARASGAQSANRQKTMQQQQEEKEEKEVLEELQYEQELQVQLLAEDDEEKAQDEKKEAENKEDQLPLWATQKNANVDSEIHAAAEEDAALRRQLAMQQEERQQEEAAHAAALVAAAEEELQCHAARQNAALDRKKTHELETDETPSGLLEELATEKEEKEKEKEKENEDVLEQQRRRKREKHARRRAEHERAVKLQHEEEQKDLAFRLTQHVDSEDRVDVSVLSIANGDDEDEKGSAAAAAAAAAAGPRSSSLVGDVKREMIVKQQAERQRRRAAALQQAALEQQRLLREEEHVRVAPDGGDAARVVEVAPREIEVVRRVPGKKPVAPVAAPMASFEF